CALPILLLGPRLVVVEAVLYEDVVVFVPGIVRSDDENDVQAVLHALPAQPTGFVVRDREDERVVRVRQRVVRDADAEIPLLELALDYARLRMERGRHDDPRSRNESSLHRTHPSLLVEHHRSTEQLRSFEFQWQVA